MHGCAVTDRHLGWRLRARLGAFAPQFAHARCQEADHGVWGGCHARVSRRSGWRPCSRSNARRPCVRVGRRPRARLGVFVTRRSVIAKGMATAFETALKCVSRRFDRAAAAFASQRSVAVRATAGTITAFGVVRVVAGMVAACGALVAQHSTVVRVEAGPGRPAFAHVELHIVQTATAHRASTHNTQRQEEYMVLAMLA